MSLIISIFILIGVLLNALICGFTALNIIYIVLASAFALYNVPFIKKLFPHSKIKGKNIIDVGIFIAFLVIVLLLGSVMPQGALGLKGKIDKSVKLINSGDTKKAEKLLLEVYEKNKDNAAINQNLAVVYLKEEKLDEVKKYLDNAYKVAPNDENLYYNYGMMYYKMKDYKNALNSFEKSAELNPLMVKSHVYAGTMSYFLKDFKRSIYHLENARFLMPSSPDILYNLAKSYAGLMEYNKANECLNDALNKNPSANLKEAINSLANEIKPFVGGILDEK